MTNWISARLWIGLEKEPSGQGLRLFVDRASIYEIETALTQYPEVDTLYFGHGVTHDVLEYFFNKVRIIVEIDRMSDVPVEFIGKIDLILRISNAVSGIKFFQGDTLSVMMLKDAKMVKWDCRKLYEGDKTIC